MEGPTLGGDRFPGIIPAGINEISEIFHELGKPTVTNVDREYDNKGNLIHERTWTISKLDALIIVGGPAFVALFYMILEKLAALGSSLDDLDIDPAALIAFGPIGAYYFKKRAEIEAAVIEEAGNLLSNLWSMITSVEVPTI